MLPRKIFEFYSPHRCNFKSLLYVKSDVKDGKFTDSSVTIFNYFYKNPDSVPRVHRD